MRHLWLAALACLVAVGMAWAEPRVALVIGNGAYTSVNPLKNPGRDAALIAGALREAGFQVTELPDADLATMNAAIARFGKALREAGPEATGLFYYAGHGVQSFGENYLLPTDTALTDAADLSLVAVDAQVVLRQMASARNRTNIVILDACRNNPFANVRDLTDQGLAEMSAPTGTFLAYATAPGSVALDGTTGNSPFTEALARRIAEPGLAIEEAFKAVRVEVLQATQGAQTPWDTSSLTGSFTFTEAVQQDAEALWANVSVSRDPVQIMLFLRAYPGSAHEAEARALLSDVMQAEVKGGGKPTPAPVTGSPVTGADPVETAAFEAAQRDGSRMALQGFLDAHPTSPFAPAVQAEIAALDHPITASPVVAAPAAGEVEAEMVAAIAGATITFDTPLAEGDAAIQGRSIADLIQTQPLFPPIEGLPKEAWEGQACKTCHQWTKPALCDQGKFYGKEAAASARIDQHPLGGAFKLNLKAWATAGCN